MNSVLSVRMMVIITAGTGKSVTGAHIAYALAMKLRLDRAKERQSSESEYPDGTRPCVMYCGSSQQSVNVVLSKQSGIMFLKPPVCSMLQISENKYWFVVF